jgi:hypothetical protein
MRICLPITLGLLLVPGTARPQAQASLSGPVLGYVWNRSAAVVQPILGIPGSSTLGAALEVGAALRTAVISPAQNYVLAVGADSGRVFVVDLQTASLMPLDGARPAPDRMVLSPTGTAAALYYQDTGAVQVITGLPDAPSVAALDASGLPRPLTALAISDQDGIVLLAASAGDSGALFLLKAGTGPQLVAPLGQASAVRFLENSHDALIADSARSEIVLVRDVAGAAGRMVLAGEQDGIVKPIDVAAFNHNQRVLATSTSAVALLALDGSVPSLLPSSGNLTGISQLGAGAVFRLSEPSGDPMVLLDAGNDQPRLLFVPAEPQAASRIRVPRARSQQ